LLKLRLGRFAFFFNSVATITSIDNFRMRDMNSPVISGGQLAAEANSGRGGDTSPCTVLLQLPPRSLHPSSSALPPCTVLLHCHHGPFIPAPAHFHHAPCSLSYHHGHYPEGRFPLLGVRCPRPHLSLPLGTLDLIVHYSEKLHSVTQNRAFWAHRLDYTPQLQRNNNK
jgi:hypothetical protein